MENTRLTKNGKNPDVIVTSNIYEQFFLRYNTDKRNLVYRYV